MKAKTSVTLDEGLVLAIDRLARGKRSRSDSIEAALREHIWRNERAQRDARDARICEQQWQELDAETGDALRFQVEPGDNEQPLAG